MQTLFEVYDCTQNILQESADKPKKYILEGICIQQNIKNRNGRIYPGAIVEKEVDRYVRECVNANRAWGELDHPVGDPRGSFKNASHKFVSVVRDGDNYIAKAVVLPKTDMGRNVVGLMEEGIIMGMSSRAVGTTKESGGAKVVQNNFHLISAGDIVTDPSAPDAYLTNLMENKEWVWENGVLVEREAEIKQAVNTYTRQCKPEALIELFERLTKLKVKRM